MLIDADADDDADDDADVSNSNSNSNINGSDTYLELSAEKLAYKTSFICKSSHRNA